MKKSALVHWDSWIFHQDKSKQRRYWVWNSHIGQCVSHTIQSGHPAANLPHSSAFTLADTSKHNCAQWSLIFAHGLENSWCGKGDSDVVACFIIVSPAPAQSQ
jgi:hypothetical protein